MLRRRFLALGALAGLGATAAPRLAAGQEVTPMCGRTGDVGNGVTYEVNGETDMFSQDTKVWAFWKKPFTASDGYEVYLDITDDFSGGRFNGQTGGAFTVDVDHYHTRFTEQYQGQPQHVFVTLSAGRKAAEASMLLFFDTGGYQRTPEETAVADALLNGERVNIVGKTRDGRELFTETVQLPKREFTRVRNALAPIAQTMLADQEAGRCSWADPNAAVGCYLTTASVGVVGLADDCWELRTLRGFRDGFLSSFEAGRALVTDYYVRAPRIVERISARPDGRAIWLRTYFGGILPSAIAARLGLNGLALKIYRAMTRRLERLAA